MQTVMNVAERERVAAGWSKKINARTRHLEVVTHTIHPATLPPTLFLTEYQLGTYHTVTQQCSCPTMVAAATVTKAEVLSQCNVFLTPQRCKPMEHCAKCNDIIEVVTYSCSQFANLAPVNGTDTLPYISST